MLKVGEDWVFLAVLGMIMAVVSFIMDTAIAMCGHARHWLVQDLVENIYLQARSDIPQSIHFPQIFFPTLFNV